MTGYHDHSDTKFMRDIREGAPREFEAWLNLDKIVAIEDGAIPRKYRELIALAVAHATQCVYCLDAHAAGAAQAGATKNEIAETSMLAAALRAGGGATHGMLAMKFFEEHSKKAGGADD
ncbi:carboxymuconolactone decarboxylase family protein [Cumulibacter manganitolerans]|uniref:carboxymuconolactone decarboxylase family protein n=1 Tax=Cumulibacter manganitolerans TaxID=1884992 RepID=UPI001294C874|nr:carboxymuconolactone decarboxylase family protein [Cumulibacter manganitolerans]